MRRLGVTPQQRAKIGDILSRSRAANAANMRELRQLDRQAHTLFSAQRIDADALEKLEQRRSTVRDALAAQHMKTRIAIAEVLTPEQRSALARTWEHRRGARGGLIIEPRHPIAVRPMAGGSEAR